MNVEHVSFLEQIALAIFCSSCWPLHLVSPSQLMNDASRKGKIRGVMRRTAIRHLVPFWRCFCSWRTDNFLYTQTVLTFTLKQQVICQTCHHIICPKKQRFTWISATTNHPQGSSSYSLTHIYLHNYVSCKIQTMKLTLWHILHCNRYNITPYDKQNLFCRTSKELWYLICVLD